MPTQQPTCQPTQKLTNQPTNQPINQPNTTSTDTRSTHGATATPPSQTFHETTATTKPRTPCTTHATPPTPCMANDPPPTKKRILLQRLLALGGSRADAEHANNAEPFASQPQPSQPPPTITLGCSRPSAEHAIDAEPSAPQPQSQQRPPSTTTTYPPTHTQPPDPIPTPLLPYIPQLP